MLMGWNSYSLRCVVPMHGVLQSVCMEFVNDTGELPEPMLCVQALLEPYNDTHHQRNIVQHGWYKETKSVMHTPTYETDHHVQWCQSEAM
jgi:hypothetical protein